MFNIYVNNRYSKTVDTRENGLKHLKLAMKQALVDDNYQDIEYSESRGSLEIWRGEDNIIYSVRED